MRALAIAAGVLALTGVANASWTVGASGAGAAQAKTMLGVGGNVPTGSVAGNSVTLTWTASLFVDGATIPSYVIRRFNSITSAEAFVLSACNGIVSGTTCTENSVPIGSWTYTVTPAAGVWRGVQSGQSAAVVITI
jgi:hypothetical protein